LPELEWEDRDDGYIGTASTWLVRADEVGDIGDFKASCEELFEWARTSDAAQDSHKRLEELDELRRQMRPRLDEIRASFMITGRCDLCR
jgi:hypothetical protein